MTAPSRSVPPAAPRRRIPGMMYIAALRARWLPTSCTISSRGGLRLPNAALRPDGRHLLTSYAISSGEALRSPATIMCPDGRLSYRQPLQHHESEAPRLILGARHAH